MSRADLSHATIEELLAADALDGLDEFDRRRLDHELGRHGPECAECRRLQTLYAEVAGRLALDAPPAALSAGAEARLLGMARGSATAAPKVLPERGPARIHPARRRWVAAAAVAAALALIGGVVGYELAPRPPSVPAEFLAFVARSGTRVISFPARGGQQLAVAVRPGQQRAWVIGSGLPDLASGRVYELWYQPQPTAKMHAAGTFTSQDGRVVVPVTVGSSFVALAVSVEPSGGSTQPTTKPVFLIST